jgi:hypothetical protein
VFGEVAGGIREARQRVAGAGEIAGRVGGGADAVEFGAQGLDETVFAGPPIGLDLRLPAGEPRVEVGFDIAAGALGDIAARSRDGLDFAGEAVGFVDLAPALAFELGAQFADFAGQAVARVRGFGLAVQRHGRERVFKARESLFDRLQWAADKDFAQALDFAGRGIFGG